MDFEHKITFSLSRRVWAFEEKSEKFCAEIFSGQLPLKNSNLSRDCFKILFMRGKLLIDIVGFAFKIHTSLTSVSITRVYVAKGNQCLKIWISYRFSLFWIIACSGHLAWLLLSHCFCFSFHQTSALQTFSLPKKSRKPDLVSAREQTIDKNLSEHKSVCGFHNVFSSLYLTC